MTHTSSGRARTFFASIIPALFIGQPASAQYLLQGSAQWRWEASLDGGATWLGGLVDAGTGSRTVSVRAVVTYETFGLPAIFGGVLLDPYVTTPSNFDDITTLSAIRGVSDASYNTNPITPQRFPGLLKLDNPADTLPPGQGTNWILTSNPGHELVNTAIMGNPIEVLRYTLVVDDTPGDRTTLAAFARRPQFPDRPLSVDTYPWQFEGYRQTVEEFPVTIRVVPTPGFASIAAIAVASLCVRRRRAVG